MVALNVFVVIWFDEISPCVTKSPLESKVYLVCLNTPSIDISCIVPIFLLESRTNALFATAIPGVTSVIVFSILPCVKAFKLDSIVAILKSTLVALELKSVTSVSKRLTLISVFTNEFDNSFIK